MIYEFKCQEHGRFEVRQSILAEHKATCPKCRAVCQRVYSTLQWMWSGSIFREDGSYREQDDYAVLKG